MSKSCIKCGYARQATDTAPEYECPKCGVIYAKAEAAIRAKEKAKLENPHDVTAIIKPPIILGLQNDTPRSRFTASSAAITAKPNLAKTIMLWLAAIAIAAISAILFDESRSFGALTLGLTCAALCLPPLRSFAKTKSIWMPNFLVTLLLMWGLAVWQSKLNSEGVLLQANIAKVNKVKEAEAAIALAKQEKAIYFEKNKPQILAEIRSKLGAGVPKEAFAQATSYTAVTTDPELTALRNEVELALFLAELKADSNLTNERRLEIYTALSTTDPSYLPAIESLKKHMASERVRLGLNDALEIATAKKRSDDQAKHDAIVDCYGVYLYGKARGDSWLVITEAVNNAKRSGACEDK